MKALIVNLIKRSLLRSGVLGLLYGFSKKKIRILMYHGTSTGSSTPPEYFEEHLKLLTKHFEIIHLKDVPKVLSGQVKYKKPVAVLTFDDGLRSNFQNAAPLLKKYGAVATFFLVPQLMKDNKMLWNHELRCRLNLLDRETVASEFGLNAESEDEFQHKVGCFIEKTKSDTGENRRELLEKMARLDESPKITDDMKSEYSLMSFEEARLLPDSIDIGSHTLTHPILDTINLEDASKEIIESKQALEQELANNIGTFCFPNGNFSESVLQIVREHYDIAVSVERGFVRKGDDLHCLKRIAAPKTIENFSTSLLY